MMAALSPQLALAAGVLGALGAGFWDGASKARFLRLLGVGALLAAAALAAAIGPMGQGLVRLDGMGLSWQLLFYFGALPFAWSLDTDDEIPFALFLGSALGMGLLAAAGNLLMLFIGLEFMSLPAYLLVARSARRGAQEASVKYFFAGATAGALFLMGMALHYAGTGSLDAGAGRGLAAGAAGAGPMAGAGLALMGAAALFKIGVFPLHFWLPDVYEASSPMLAGFLSTAMKSAGVLLLLRLAALDPSSALAAWLPALGAASMLFGSAVALRQTGLQRLLAYSSIAHAGALVLGVGAWARQGASPAAAAGVYFYLGAYLFMSNGAFAFVRWMGLSEISELRGLARRRPAAAALFAVLLLSLAGIPPTAGFLAKFLIFWEAVKAGLYAAAALGGLSALVALGYYLGLIRDMYFEEPGAGMPPPGVVRTRPASESRWRAADRAITRGSAASESRWRAAFVTGIAAVVSALFGAAPGVVECLARMLS